MFDIGFSELLVVGGVALVVLGPEKLAVVARSAGKWTSKAQRYVNDVKADMAREGELAELRKLKSEMEAAGQDIKSSLQTTASDVQADFAAIEAQAKLDAAAEAHSSAAIQASLDSTSNSILPPRIVSPELDFAEKLTPPPLQDPIALQMDLDALQMDFYALEARMTKLRTELGTALSNAGKAL